MGDMGDIAHIIAYIPIGRHRVNARRLGSHRGLPLQGRGRTSRESYDIHVLRDEMVGRIAYALDLSTGIFIDLFGNTTCGFRITRHPPVV